MSQTNILLEAGTNELEIVEFFLDEPGDDGKPYRGYYGVNVAKVLEIIHKYIKKAQEPDNAQNKRLDELDKRVGTLEQGQLQHTQALARDLRRFDGIDEEMRLVLVGVQNLLDAQLSGNNREGMQ